MKAIPKLQQGGFAGLFANYTPLQGAPTKASQPQARASAPSSGGGGNDGKLTEKDLFNLMKDVKGLPNDMAALVKNLYEMYTVAVATGDTQNLAAIYLQNLMQLKTNVYNQEEYDHAYELVKTNGGLNEIAIATNGKVAVQDKETGQVKFMSIEEINDSVGGNFSTLTNSQLLYLRAHSPSLTNDNTILQTVENGIGMEQVAKMVQERLISLGNDKGTDKGSTTYEFPAVAGAEVLQSLIEQGQDGGWTEVKKSKSWERLSQTQKRQAENALFWILGSLPSNAKTLLTIKAGGEEKATGLVWNLIQSRTSSEYLNSDTIGETWTYHAPSGGKGKGKGSGNGDDLEDVKWNSASEWLKGYGTTEMFTINPGSIYSYGVTANGLMLTDSENKPLGAGSTLQEVSKGGFGGILNMQQATMGGHRINSTVLNQVFVDDGMVYSIDFPVLPNNPNVPDLRSDTLRKKKQADETIKAYGINLKDPEDVRRNVSRINQVYQSFGLGDAYNPDGSVNSRKWRRFGVMNGTVDGRALGTDALGNNSLLSPITDDYTKDALVSRIKKDTKDYTFDDNRWFGEDDTFYRGTIWIPVNESFIASQAGTGNTFTSQTGLATNIQDQYLQMNRQASMNLNLTTNHPR